MKTVTNINKTISILYLLAMSLCPFSLSHAQSDSQNYIVVKTYTSTTAHNDVVQYYDGLGRPVQSVRKQFTPGSSPKDLVTRIEYDNFGRESKAWLPVPNNNSSGAFDNSTSVISFYNNDSAYSETKYEPSPLNRIQEQYGPGKVWRDNTRRVKTEYQANTSSGDLVCPYYYIQDSWTLRKKGNYDAGQLYVTKITDEDNNISYEFKDKLGRVLLERRMAGNQKHDVNYVYDDFGNLVCVLPPLVSDALTADNTNFNVWGSGTANEQLTNSGYWYYYDSRNRMKGSITGAITEYVYDKADRLVFTQTPKASDSDVGRGWLFNKYDALGRLIMTGRYLGDEGNANNENVRAENMQNRWQNLLSQESRNSSKAYGYTWNTFPTDSNSVVVIQVNYYDDYTWLSGISNGVSQLDYQSKSGYDARHSSAKGLLTGTRVKLLSDNPSANEWITTTYHYDYKGNLVQKHATNQLGGYDKEYYAYNYNNQVTKKRIEHNSSTQSMIPEEYEYLYDSQLRLTDVKHKLGDGATLLTLAQYTYNNLGQVATKATGGVNTTTYAYNIRGWETERTGTKFSEKLYYADNPKTGGNKYYGGNISALTWNYTGSSTTRGYAFQYDSLSRLKDAAYGETVNLSSNTQRYSENFTYDKHGNPLTIKRYGKTGSSAFGLIDNLTIPKYAGNRIRVVNDAAGDQTNPDLMEFKNGFNNPDEEYVYNAAGAMYADYNRKICMFKYNYLLLPQSVQFRYGHRIEYTYDASGMKRSVKYREASHDMNYYPWDPGVPAATDFLAYQQTKQYTGDKVYEDGQMKLILTEDGYIVWENNGWNRYYYLKDHLGNNRIVMGYSGNTVQQTDYYPSGTVMAESTNPWVQPYKFGGKELDRSKGLDFFDFEWRPYDPTLVRFTVPDPLAEKYYAISPYAYCANNPVNYIDPTGEDYWSTNNPEQIRAFLNAIGSGSTQFDFSSGWNHMTDAEFADRLSYNDETGKYWISYGTVENGEAVINARSFDANITPVSSSGEGYPGAFIYKPRTGFLGLMERFDSFLNPYSSPHNSYDDGTNTWSVNSSGRIIGIAPPAPITGYPPMVGKGKISTRGMPHGDAGRALSQAERRIAELEKQLQTATGKDKKAIQQTIKNIRETAQKKAKGETHWRK